jgi:hypothetical protein
MTIQAQESPVKVVTGAFELFALCALIALPRFASGQERAPKTTLEGKLVSRAGRGPVLRASSRDVPLAATTTYLLHTLEDHRLVDREVRLEGTMRPDGRFEVAHLYTVRDGKLYKVRYYCEICNIAALEPGRCVCCQRPTELQEIPVSETDKDTVAE